MNSVINGERTCRYFSYSPIYRLFPRKPNIPFNVLLKGKFPHVIFQDNSSPTGIKVLIELERRLLPFILKYYLPAMASAVVSLVNYLIPVDCMPARVSLLVTQFLTLTNILIYQQVGKRAFELPQ